MGTLKALVEIGGEPLVRRALRALVDGGAAPVVVVLGARAAAVRAVLPADVTIVEAAGWEAGMGASLRAGLAALARPGAEGTPADAAVVHLVDLPGVPAAAVARLRAAADGPAALARAAYDGRAGHPVLLGRAHWAGVAAAATGDAGARHYLAGRTDVRLVECGDLAVADDRVDLDTPEQLAAFTARHRL